MRLGKRTDPRWVPIRDLVPLAPLSDLEFGAWDIFPDSAYESALSAGVLTPETLAPVRERYPDFANFLSEEADAPAETIAPPVRRTGARASLGRMAANIAHEVRITSYILIIATFVTLADLLLAEQKTRPRRNQK